MTVNSSAIGANWFLDGLAKLQKNEIETQRQLSSGFKVQDAADAPAETQDLIDLGSSLAGAQTYQAILDRVNAEAAAGNQAIASATTLLQNARSVSVLAANTTATAADRLSYDQQIAGIQQQLAAIANTNVEGRYIFGGDADQSAPYALNSASATGVDALTSSPGTRQIQNPAGQVVYQAPTAGAIFDNTTAGLPAPDNAFAALQSLRIALQANDSVGIAASIDSLQSASDRLNQYEVAYGAAQQQIASEQNDIASRVTTLQTRISGIRDADIAQAASDLAQDTAGQTAAFASQAEIGNKSLFDFLA